MPVRADGEINANLLGRFTAKEIKTKRGRSVIEKGAVIAAEHMDDLVEAFADDEEATVPVRSVLKCQAEGICQQCYGRAPATGKVVAIGDAVGIIAAQSIG